MEMLNRSMNLAQMRKTVDVECPEWSLQVRLRELSAGQLPQLDQDVSKQLALMIVDDNGDRIYVTPEQIDQLREMPAMLQQRLLEAAAELNGMTPKAADEAIKN